jgi:hypothetical protein
LTSLPILTKYAELLRCYAQSLVLPSEAVHGLAMTWYFAPPLRLSSSFESSLSEHWFVSLRSKPRWYDLSCQLLGPTDVRGLRPSLLFFS